MSLISELKRRNVLRVAAAYVVTAWLVIQVAETILPIYGFPDAALRYLITGLAVGIAPVLILAWALWLSFALVRWLPWVWKCFSSDGFWRTSKTT
mgnify:CR=1 FL=1